MNRRDRRALGLGATGEFPKGKLHESDEGALRIAVGMRGGNVIVDFGTPTVWIGLPRAEALALAESIKKAAESIQ